MVMEIIVNGVLLGAAYCLMTTGFALLISVGKVFDLTYGIYYLLSAYSIVGCVKLFEPHTGFLAALIIGILVGITASSILASFVHWQLIGPLRGQTFSIFIITVMFALCMQESLIYTWGAENIHVPLFARGMSQIFGVDVMNQKILILIVTVSIVLSLWIFLGKTKLGLALRSVAESQLASRIVGIRLSKIYFLTGVLGGALGAISGAFLCSIYVANPYAWMEIITIPFFIVIIAGMGNIWACIPAAMIAGLIEVSSGFLIPQGVFLGRPILLTIMIFFILLKPNGLFGVRGWEDESE